MSQTTIEAVVLINVLKDIPGVMKKIKNDPRASRYIEDMSLVFGGADIIANVRIQSIAQLHDLVIDYIQGLDEVSQTQTFIIDPKAKIGINKKIDHGTEEKI
ncbi:MULTISPECIES: Lrp/AsnC ligand binding domain-containing protein [Rhodomicrobium]|uniref:Lrp/AsnC ligand binding domain-containing protein n=1 Tax=Rhodomicrobium TaxID=1068 RepID=UPI000B4A5CE4|nr:MULTISPECIES: Lrp/AsnC ligand binding domain-containing protein [Rhodomicrobium]